MRGEKKWEIEEARVSTITSCDTYLRTGERGPQEKKLRPEHSTETAGQVSKEAGTDNARSGLSPISQFHAPGRYDR